MLSTALALSLSIPILRPQKPLYGHSNPRFSTYINLPSLKPLDSICCHGFSRRKTSLSATITAFQFGWGTVMINILWALSLCNRPKLTRPQILAILPLAVAHTFGNLLTNVSLGKVAVSFTHTIKALEPFFTVLFAALFLGEVRIRDQNLTILPLLMFVCKSQYRKNNRRPDSKKCKAADIHSTVHKVRTVEKPAFWALSSLVPIAGGVALASLTEASFNWIGFCSAMASNVTNQSRNVFSKKLMANKEEALDNINLFSVITIISFILLVPAAIFMEGFKFTPSYLQSAANQGLNVRELCIRSLLAGFCLHSYQQVSYMILQMVNPVTHAVGNCVKRVVVIVSSVIFFQTPVSPINSIGTAMALAGVFLYSRAKRMKPETKPKAA
ncbi:hypothetical protein DKX38_025403 [Salix brachista]|uniref:Sugar phosphate transporter domain-containing protein n=1 Tax=Salix brachista TaxID=2182728 RepID=A0A5N5JSN7_9ROSI|nr:hypothetical protein DKX38_025403 [Salix brachista]